MFEYREPKIIYGYTGAGVRVMGPDSMRIEGLGNLVNKDGELLK